MIQLELIIQTKLGGLRPSVLFVSWKNENKTLNNMRVWKTSQNFHFRFLNLHEGRGILHLRTDHNNERLTLSRSIRSRLPFEEPVYMESLYFVKTPSAETATHFTCGRKAGR